MQAKTFIAKIEIPAGSIVKYETATSGHIIVDRFMSMSVSYPANYASIEHTLAEDGDPLDTLVLTREPLRPGVLIKCRTIGYLRMNDSGDEDQKLISVPVEDVDLTYDEVHDIQQLAKAERKRIEDFFATYKLLNNKKVVLDGYADAEAAEKILQAAQEAYVPTEVESINRNDYPQSPKAPEEIRVAIEIPQDTSIKYELDEMGYVIADRFPSVPVVYPINYGSIVSSLADDGDPLDALVLARAPIYPGAIITCRPIGYLEMVDNEEHDQKVIAVPVDEVDFTYKDVESLADLPQGLVNRIEQFFSSYKRKLSGSNTVRLAGYKDLPATKELIISTLQAFKPHPKVITNLHDYPQSEDLDALKMVVEVPQGTSIKYEYNHAGQLVVDRFMSTSVIYPANYGFLPQTIGGDASPVDVLVYTRSPLVAGCIISIRPIGVLRMLDDGKVDDKIIAVPAQGVDTYYDEINDIEDLPEMECLRLEQFFKLYKTFAGNSQIETKGFGNAAVAKELLQICLKK